MHYERPILKTITERLGEQRNKIQILLGARQVGKTTLIQQALRKITTRYVYAIAESGFTAYWIEQQWSIARSYQGEVVLVFDEIQKIDQWSERVKRLYDEDTALSRPIKLVLLGSSALLLHRGLTESMAGRFEIIPITHWSYLECVEAFGITLDEFFYFGGYPGALFYKNDEERFRAYMRDSIIEPVVSRDILSQFIIHKPALLRELFRLGCTYSGQILSFNKMLGQLHDAGNTTTLSHYLTLLEQSFVVRGIYKYTNEPLRLRQSSPKLQVYNTALQTSILGKRFNQIIEDPELKGRIVESSIGAYLLSHNGAEVYYWRENNKEVDFIVKFKGKLIAIEVKSGKKQMALPGLAAFQFESANKLLIGTGGIPIDIFLKTPFEHFIT